MREADRRRRDELLFETPPAGFASASRALRTSLVAEHEQGSPERRAELVDLVAGLCVDLRSHLVRWHLQRPGRDERLPDETLQAEVAQHLDVLGRWGAHEALEEVAAEAASIESSNLRRLAERTEAGRLHSCWGHDAASGLRAAIRRGATFVTTNPVMVNTVRKEDPATWDPVRDALKASHPAATPQQRVSLMTMSVALAACRELRPLWQASDGRYGHVSLQVDPSANDDAGRMAEEAEELFGRLRTELGGEPNTRFKIPGTAAGLEAVRRLTAKGIGVTVTINASVDQQLAFAEVIEAGSAPLSFVVLMMGRLDDPVRDELVAAGMPDAAEVSRWASVAVLRRAYPLLYEERGYRRSTILAASMRGPWTIDGSIVDGPAEVFVSIFPDKAREYDAVPREPAAHQREPLPAGIVEKLSRSETFRLAHGVGVLPVEAFGSFVPVRQTLEQFARNYDEFVDYNR